MTGADDLPTVYDSVVHMLADAASRRPDAIALNFGKTELTYGNYVRSVGRLLYRLWGSPRTQWLMVDAQHRDRAPFFGAD